MQGLFPRVISRPSRALVLSAAAAAVALIGLSSSADAVTITQPIAWSQFATNSAGTADPNNTSITAGAAMQTAFNKNNPKVSGSIVDYANNRLYVATNVGLDRGSVTILNATTGAVIQKLDTTGGVSQMVVAGDGKVYGVVNQRTALSGTGNETSGQAYRIIQFGTANQTTYSVNTIWQPSNIGQTSTTTPICGLGLNPANKNPIWTMSGVNAATKSQAGWEYDTTAATANLRTTGQVGNGLTRGAYGNSTAVGLNANGKPVVAFYGNTSNNPVTDSLYFDSTPNPSIVGGEVIPSASTGFVNAAVTSSAYSISHNNFWEGFSGSGGSTLIAVRNGTNNPNGDTATAGVYANSGTTAVFHVAPDNLGPPGPAFAGNWMVPTMIDDGAGNIFYATNNNPADVYAQPGTQGLIFGKVMQMDTSGTYYDDGVPAIQSGRTATVISQEQVVSLSSAPMQGGGLVIFATTLDTTGQYRVYKSPGIIVPEPASLGLLAVGGLLALGRRRH